ncbi:basic secretory family protein [Mucilaginibacter sp. UR6-11]|uniref:basic secretory family protein n=1 Tax=Mucilaginibacter sp. UR6-11 TaxID=1435644 RepID=UPI001E4411BD|nr:basic secretory family protein [Mucilaginibacter sp. UR6-11]MCC8426267.1 basic secretory family protein [Mucilaginibacter sp. UR6-11]
MLKKISNLAFLLMLAAAAFAQTTPPPTAAPNSQPTQRRRNAPRPYAVTITDNSKKFDLDTVKENQLTEAFKNVYPGFAAADGYRTAREVTMTISDTLKQDLTAKAGEISVNGKWLKKKKNFAKFQQTLQDQLHKNWNSVDTIRKDGYQLVFINKNSDFSPAIKQDLINTYFTVFPKLVSMFNGQTTHEVVFVTDTAYKGVAEASGNRILFSTKYMNAHPYDIDIVTHEGMHIVQGYGYGSGPVWLTEGIADFIRYKYGVNNIGSKWYLPAFKSTQSYKDSYRVTARFFEWIDQKVKPGMIVRIDKELRNHTYTEATWAALSGKTIDELWDAYAKNPEVTLKYSGKEAAKI